MWFMLACQNVFGTDFKWPSFVKFESLYHNND